MAKRKREHFIRFIALGVISVAISLIFTARLINIQIAGQDYYTEKVTDNTYTRTEKIQAQRGSIYDTNGNLMVSNEYSYNIYFDAGDMPSGLAKNDVVLKVVELSKKMGEDESFSLPDHPFVNINGTWIFDEDYMSTVFGKRLNKLLTDLGFKPDENEDEEDTTIRWTNTKTEDLRNALLERYGIIDEDGLLQYDEDIYELLFKLRLDMELHYFSASEPYTILTDVSVKLITAVKEEIPHGVKVDVKSSRVYSYPGVASHILGRTGKITAETAEYYTEQGYKLDAIVGISGAELAFEEYLHGEDGELTIVEDEYGNILSEYVSLEPVSGKDVYLTLDVNYQKAAEKALADNIKYIVDKAEAEIEDEEDTSLIGEDANAGALTLISCKDNSVLALASYPTYDLSTFNEDYEELTKNEASPLFFRALEGTYAPGSTFKPGVAVAALSEGIITPTTEIEDTGKYTYYEDYQPSCWIYSQKYGFQRHGFISVAEAIQVSCNCFFYDVGRRLTISTMNKYCSAYGLGKPTGIELSEKVGVLASPSEREDYGGTWYDGDTLQAAIGQSDNLFNPLQISVYISTLLNNGDRYSAHILKEVRDYDGNVVYQYEPNVIDKADVTKEAVKTVKYAMKDVTENGSAARVFADYKIAIGGKTGTAQVSKNSSDNAIFTAFAPFDNPEIVATSVIEKGASGTDAGFAIRDVFTAYFK